MNSSPPMWIIGLIVLIFLFIVGCCIYFLVIKPSSPSPSGSPSAQGESSSSVATLSPGQAKQTGPLYQSEADQQSMINQCIAKLGPGDNPAMCGTVRRAR